MTELTPEDVETLCTAGSLAPSGGNAQPWQVTVTGNRLRITVNDNDNGFLDVGGYASYIAIGAFAENVAITAQSIGLGYAMVISDGAVAFDFAGRRTATPHELYEFLPERVTNRRLADGPPLTDADIARLTDVVGDDAFTVTAVADEERKGVIAEALGRADVLRLRNGPMFADMMREMRWSQTEVATSRNGMDTRTLELPASTLSLLSVLRRVPWLRMLLPTGPLAATAKTLVHGCSHICCLSGPAEPTRDAMVTAGMAVQRLWLAATRDGHAMQPWTVATLQLIRLERFGGNGFSERERRGVARIGEGLRAGFGIPADRTPIFVFRLSHAPRPSARALRLPWRSFTERVGDDG